ncbi:isochorismate synthase MenF [Candidatus Uabimicrobium sp. HlEnr_7]|uniref:isochorismate synthase n=1 Tax=Candidatus Uabimicrobium helgolandensis TaxID=3095367 RepID=UPI003555F084
MRVAKNLRELNDMSYVKKMMLRQLQSFFTQESIQNSRLEVEIEDIDVVSWLRIQNYDEKIYWENRDKTFVIAGVGAARIFKSDCFDDFDKHLNLLPNGMRFYGGMRFDNSSTCDALWRSFANITFFIPQFEICRREDKVFFVTNILLKKGTTNSELFEIIVNELERVEFFLSPTYDFEGLYNERVNSPSFDEWKEQFEDVQKQFCANEIEKIVLARRSTFVFSSCVDGFCLLQHFVNTQENTYNFYIQWEKDCAFVGATPERLYQRFHNRIYSEAVAGTRIRGKTLEEDSELGKDLLSSSKDVKEHRLVVENIQRVFNDICKKYINVESPRLLKLKNLQHLYTSFEGILKKDIRDSDVLSLLHPTAAVCGLPKEKNIDLIAKLESFDRGWFAGPIGWLGKDSAEFAVAIRSCLVQNNILHLFAGAGIVESSSVEKEWNEIEDKMRNFDCIFGKESPL